MVDIFQQFREFKTFEITFTNNIGELKKLLCDVSAIEDDCVIVNANNEKNKNITAEAGTDIKLYIYTDNGIYSSTSKIIDVEQGTTNTTYMFEYPKNTKHSQRREFFRADMSIDFEIKATPKNNTEQITTIKGKTKNICGKGMNYVSNKPFPENNSILVELNFDSKIISTTANLVYSKAI